MYKILMVSVSSYESNSWKKDKHKVKKVVIEKHQSQKIRDEEREERRVEECK